MEHKTRHTRELWGRYHAGKLSVSVPGQPFFFPKLFPEAPSRMKSYIIAILFLALAGCEGPIGPQGERGPAGSRGPTGIPPEATFIRVGNLTRALYDGFGRIIIEDSRISPSAYRGVFIEVTLGSYRAFMPPPQLFEVEIHNGRLLIHDQAEYLILYRDELKQKSLESDGVETSSLENARYVLMVLVQ